MDFNRVLNNWSVSRCMLCALQSPSSVTSGIFYRRRSAHRAEGAAPGSGDPSPRLRFGSGVLEDLLPAIDEGFHMQEDDMFGADQVCVFPFVSCLEPSCSNSSQVQVLLCCVKTTDQSHTQVSIILHESLFFKVCVCVVCGMQHASWTLSVAVVGCVEAEYGFNLNLTNFKYS